MGMQLGGGGKGSSLADINVTPLVDVMLVLLVIFMVTAPMMSSDKSKIDLPPVDTGQTIELTDDDVVLVIKQDKVIHFKGCPTCTIGMGEFIEKIKANPRVQKAKRVYLYGHQKLKYKYILQIMDKLNKAGVKRVNLVTNPGGKKIDKKPK